MLTYIVHHVLYALSYLLGKTRFHQTAVWTLLLKAVSIGNGINGITGAVSITLLFMNQYFKKATCWLNGPCLLTEVVI